MENVNAQQADRWRREFVLFGGCSVTEWPNRWISIAPIQLVAANLQEVSPLSAQPEHLEQGPEEMESVPGAKTQQVTDGWYLIV